MPSTYHVFFSFIILMCIYPTHNKLSFTTQIYPFIYIIVRMRVGFWFEVSNRWPSLMYRPRFVNSSSTSIRTNRQMKQRRSGKTDGNKWERAREWENFSYGIITLSTKRTPLQHCVAKQLWDLRLKTHLNHTEYVHRVKEAFHNELAYLLSVSTSHKQNDYKWTDINCATAYIIFSVIIRTNSQYKMKQ